MTAISAPPAAPTVSVLMAVRDGERYLAAALDSILAQTFADFELVVIDDGSTDSSAAILGDYAGRDARLRWQSLPHQGLTRSLNQAFADSRGRYLARFDGDDVALPARLAKQCEWLDAHPETVCVGGAFDLIDGAGRFLTTLQPPTEDEAIQRALLAGHGAINHSAAMIRRAAMERVGGYDPRFDTAQDVDLWLRLGEIGELANLGDPVVRVRLHAASISERMPARQRQMARLACEEAWQRRGLRDVVFEAADPWRPGADRASRHRFALLYGWWAFNSGERRTAMIYGARAIRAQPLRREGWILLACGAVKRRP